MYLYRLRTQQIRQIRTHRYRVYQESNPIKYIIISINLRSFKNNALFYIITVILYLIDFAQ